MPGRTLDDALPRRAASIDRRPPAAAVPARYATPLVLLGYGALALAITWSWWTPLGEVTTAVNATDATLFSWLLGWTPHALAAGQLPLFTDRLNAPAGVNLMWNNGMFLPALLCAPVTAAFGGAATVTVLTTLGMAGSAASAHLCLRAKGLPQPRIGVPAAAVGGALFGFSPAMTAQALGHPNLVFNVLLPVLVLLALRLLLSARPLARDAVLLGVLAGAQLLVGEEALFLTGVVVALLVAVLALSHPATARRRAGRFAVAAGLALAAFLVVAGFPLAYQLAGPLPQSHSPFVTSYYALDLANYVLPTRMQALADPDVSRPFPGGLEEQTGYLGWPLLLLAAAGLVLRWHRPRIRVPLLVALGTAVLALGSRLTVAGQPTGVPLPWALLAGLPGFEHVIVTRFALFTAGFLGAALACAWDELPGGPPVLRAGVLLTVAAALVPLLPAPLPAARLAPVPAFFTAPTGPDPSCQGGSLLVLPFPRAGATEPMRWQQEAGYAFAMPGGYFIGPGPDGHAYVHGTPSATGTLFQEVLADGRPREATAQLRADFAADLDRWRACAAVLGPTRNQDALRAQATALIGAEPQQVGGVYLWRLRRP